MTELIVGTKKGAFVLEGEPGGRFQQKARAFAGEPVDYATRDPRSGRYFASVTSPVYGPKLFYTDDPAGEWTQAEGPSLPEESGKALVRMWMITPAEDERTLYAGGDPGVLFESDDLGASWRLNEALWNEPTRDRWQPGGGGLALHAIAPWPGDPDRLAVAVSAAGVWITEDRGRSWHTGNEGMVARYMPEDDADPLVLCVHRLQRAPRRPERMFIQFHGGVYRSDDAGESWQDIAGGLPSDFGFPLVVDPADPDSAYVIPLQGDYDRVTPEGRVRVYETRDGGESWSPRGEGLPQEHAYLTVLRHGFDRTGEGEDLELYFGATSGDLFGSGDAGASWFTVAERLPPVYSVAVAS